MAKGLLKEVTKHSLIYGVGDILSKAIGFLLIPLYTHYLSPSDYGTLEIIGLVTFIASLFLGLGINIAISRFYYLSSNDETRRQVIGNSLALVWIFGAISLVIALPFSKQISYLVFKTFNNTHLISIVLLTTVIQLSTEVGMTLIRLQERSALFTAINLIKLLFTVGLNILFVAFMNMSVLGIVLSTLITSGLHSASLLSFSIRHSSKNINYKLALEMLKYGAPLAVGSLAMLSLHFADRLFIQEFSDLAEVGLYGLAYKFAMLPGIFVVVPFMRYWEVKRFDLGDEETTRKISSRMFTYFCFFNFFSCLVISSLGPSVIRIISEKSFHDAGKFLPTLVLAYGIFGLAGQVAFGALYAKRTELIAYANVFSAILNLLFNYVLIKRFDAWGACFSTLLSYLILTISTNVASQRSFKISYEKVRIFKILLIFVLLVLVSTYANYQNELKNLALGTLICLLYPILLISIFSKEEKLKIKNFILPA